MCRFNREIPGVARRQWRSGGAAHDSQWALWRRLVSEWNDDRVSRVTDGRWLCDCDCVWCGAGRLGAGQWWMLSLVTRVYCSLTYDWPARRPSCCIVLTHYCYVIVSKQMSTSLVTPRWLNLYRPSSLRSYYWTSLIEILLNSCQTNVHVSMPSCYAP